MIKDGGVRYISQALLGKHLHYAIASATHYPAAVLAPHNRTYALTSHDAVEDDLLHIASLLH